MDTSKYWLALLVLLVISLLLLSGSPERVRDLVDFAARSSLMSCYHYYCILYAGLYGVIKEWGAADIDNTVALTRWIKIPLVCTVLTIGQLATFTQQSTAA